MKKLTTLQNKEKRLLERFAAKDKETKDLLQEIAANRREQQAILKVAKQKNRKQEERCFYLFGKLVTLCAAREFYEDFIPRLAQHESAFVRTYTYRGKTRTDNSDLHLLKSFIADKVKTLSPPEIPKENEPVPFSLLAEELTLPELKQDPEPPTNG